jgi:hypothetical protein
MSDEPVAYLGGDQGASEPPPPPEGDEEQVDGYLGGQGGEEESLPSLPPQESRETYSAKDFLDSEQPAEAPPEEDPYADPYGAPAATEEQPAGYGDYEGYDAAAVQQTDPAYFDSMAHSGEAAAEEAPPAEEYAADEGYGGDDPDSPKTISQQDAESIIRRITTKRILPPESTTEKKTPLAPAPKLTEVGGGPRIFPLLVVVTLIVGALGAFFFGEDIATQFPGLRPYMPWVKQEVAQAQVEQVKPKDPNEEAKKAMLELILKSEAKAFGVALKDVPAAPTAAGTRPTTSTATRPGTTTGTAPTTETPKTDTTTSTGGN